MLATFWSETLKGRDHSEDLGIDRMMIRNESYINRLVSCGLDLSGSRWKPVAGSCVDGNEPSGSIKGEEFLD
jgi:hypothetical protein